MNYHDDDDDDSCTTLGQSSIANSEALLAPTPSPKASPNVFSPATQTLNTLSQSHQFDDERFQRKPETKKDKPIATTSCLPWRTRAERTNDEAPVSQQLTMPTTNTAQDARGMDAATAEEEASSPSSLAATEAINETELPPACEPESQSDEDDDEVCLQFSVHRIAFTEPGSLGLTVANREIGDTSYCAVVRKSGQSLHLDVQAEDFLISCGPERAAEWCSYEEFVQYYDRHKERPLMFHVARRSNGNDDVEEETSSPQLSAAAWIDTKVDPIHEDERLSKTDTKEVSLHQQETISKKQDAPDPSQYMESQITLPQTPMWMMEQPVVVQEKSPMKESSASLWSNYNKALNQQARSSREEEQPSSSPRKEPNQSVPNKSNIKQPSEDPQGLSSRKEEQPSSSPWREPSQSVSNNTKTNLNEPPGDHQVLSSREEEQPSSSPHKEPNRSVPNQSNLNEPSGDHQVLPSREEEQPSSSPPPCKELSQASELSQIEMDPTQSLTQTSEGLLQVRISEGDPPVQQPQQAFVCMSQFQEDDDDVANPTSKHHEESQQTFGDDDVTAPPPKNQESQQAFGGISQFEEDNGVAVPPSKHHQESQQTFGGISQFQEDDGGGDNQPPANEKSQQTFGGLSQLDADEPSLRTENGHSSSQDQDFAIDDVPESLTQNEAGQLGAFDDVGANYEEERQSSQSQTPRGRGRHCTILLPDTLDPNDLDTFSVNFCDPCAGGGGANHHSRCPKNVDKFVKSRFLDTVEGFNLGCIGCKSEYKYGLGKQRHNLCKRVASKPSRGFGASIAEKSKTRRRRSSQGNHEESQPTASTSTSRERKRGAKNIAASTKKVFEFPEKIRARDKSKFPVNFCEPCSGGGSEKHHNRCSKSQNFDQAKFLNMVKGYNKGCTGCKAIYRYGYDKRTHTTCDRGLAAASQITLMQSSDDEEEEHDVLVPFCKSCKTQRGDHHKMCPHHHAFETSGGREALECILTGVEVGCRLCLKRYQGEKSPAGQHANQCPRRGKPGRAPKRKHTDQGSKASIYESLTTIMVKQRKRGSSISATETSKVKAKATASSSVPPIRKESTKRKMKLGIQLGCKACVYERDHNKKPRYITHQEDCPRSARAGKRRKHNPPKGIPMEVDGDEACEPQSQLSTNSAPSGMESPGTLTEDKIGLVIPHLTSHQIIGTMRTVTAMGGEVGTAPNSVSGAGGDSATKRHSTLVRSSTRGKGFISRSKSESQDQDNVDEDCQQLEVKSKSSTEQRSVRGASTKGERISSRSKPESQEQDRVDKDDDIQIEVKSKSSLEQRSLPVERAVTKGKRIISRSKPENQSQVQADEDIQFEVKTKSSTEQRTPIQKELHADSKKMEQGTSSLDRIVVSTTTDSEHELSVSKSTPPTATSPERDAAKAKFVDESVGISEVVVPFCRACRNAPKTDIHHALCPQHPYFSSSGALEKLEIIRYGTKIDCAACTVQYENGCMGKHKVGHSDECQRFDAAYRKKKESDAMVKVSTPGHQSNPGGKRKSAKRLHDANQLDVLSPHVNKRHKSSRQLNAVTPDERASKNECAKVRLDSQVSTIKQTWKSCENPWGPIGYQFGDVVISGDGGFTHHEAHIPGKRFTVDPFGTESGYKATHFSPGEATHTLKLIRDAMSTVSWGFSVEHHDFGGACLVDGVDPNSPAADATFVGTSEHAPLYVHDMIVALNGKDISGWTEAGVEIELETSGVELTVTISRYRFPSVVDTLTANLETETWANLDASLRDKRNLGWCELDLTAKFATKSQLLKGMESNRPLSQQNVDLDEDMSALRDRLSLSQAQMQVASIDDIEEEVVVNDDDGAEQEETEQGPMVENHSQEVGVVGEEQDQGITVDEDEPEDQGINVDEDDPEVVDIDDVSKTHSAIYENWDDDDNPWVGCVCNVIHDPPATVFWIQCEGCDTWYNVAPDCIGFDEEKAQSLSSWTCRACPTDDDEDD